MHAYHAHSVEPTPVYSIHPSMPRVPHMMDAYVHAYMHVNTLRAFLHTRRALVVSHPVYEQETVIPTNLDEKRADVP